jgi:hypothetical protein
MTVSARAIKVLYPVVGGAGAALVTRAAVSAARQFVVGGNETPSGRSGGGTALGWTVLSWAVAGGVGVYAGKKLVRPTPVRSGVVAQPAQS